MDGRQALTQHQAFDSNKPQAESRRWIKLRAFLGGRRQAGEKAGAVGDEAGQKHEAIIAGIASATAAPNALTPTRPIPSGRALVGRQRETARILRAFTEEHVHVVLYSERGRGKTSLVNALVETLRARGYIVARHTCEMASTYDSIMRGLTRDMPRGLLAVSVPREHEFPEEASEGCSAALPSGVLRPNDILALPSRLNCPNLICIIDEFDRIVDAETRTQLANTIKQLSDRDAALSFMIVGVSDNLDQILGQHPSIQRALVAVHLPLLTTDEVTPLVLGDFKQAGLRWRRRCSNASSSCHSACLTRRNCMDSVCCKRFRTTAAGRPRRPMCR